MAKSPCLLGFVVFQLMAMASGAVAQELHIFEVDRPVTQADRGFPWNEPPFPEVNGDWTQPTNFAEGTLHFRAEIRGQPESQTMQLQFCMWQRGRTGGFKELENCGEWKPVQGDSGFTLTWSTPIAKMWKKNDRPLDWDRPRQTYGIGIKNGWRSHFTQVKAQKRTRKGYI